MRRTDEATYFIKDLKEEPAPHLMRGSLGRCMGSVGFNSSGDVVGI